MKYIVLFHQQSEVELLESKKWYAHRSIKASERFVTEINNTIDNLQKSPFSQAIIYRKKRKINLNNFPFSIIYSIDKNTILILSIFHYSRNPKIWKKR